MKPKIVVIGGSGLIGAMVVGKLKQDKDPRNVVMGDPGGLFYGIQLDDQALMPGRDARLGSTTFDWWLTH